MFFRPGEHKAHGLARDPFKSLVVPRPIGWISTVSRDGVPNLAPYSFFNAVASDPPQVIFASGDRADGAKDSQRNAEETGEFVVNLATWDLREQMNQTSATLAHGTDEMALAGLEAIPSTVVKAPRVKGTPVHLECVYQQTVLVECDTPGRRNCVVFGRVVGIHIDDRVVRDGRVDVRLFRPIARLGYMDYAVVDDVFAMDRPK